MRQMHRRFESFPSPDQDSNTAWIRVLKFLLGVVVDER